MNFIVLPISFSRSPVSAGQLPGPWPSLRRLDPLTYGVTRLARCAISASHFGLAAGHLPALRDRRGFSFRLGGYLFFSRFSCRLSAHMVEPGARSPRKKF